MRVRLLGPVDVTVDDTVRPVSGLRRKAILAILSLHAGEIVSADRLKDIVWRDDAPGLNTLQSHVSHLRSVLGSKAAILAKPPGYVLDLGDDGTDVLHAERLLRQASRSADPARSASELREALAMWRGRPLADVTGIAWLEEQAERLELLREQISQALADARLASGEHAEYVLARIAGRTAIDSGVDHLDPVAGADIQDLGGVQPGAQLGQARRNLRAWHGKARDLLDAGMAIGQAHDTDLVHCGSLTGRYADECHRMVTDLRPPGKECEGCPAVANRKNDPTGSKPRWGPQSRRVNVREARRRVQSARRAQSAQRVQLPAASNLQVPESVTSPSSLY